MRMITLISHRIQWNRGRGESARSQYLSVPCVAVCLMCLSQRQVKKLRAVYFCVCVQCMKKPIDGFLCEIASSDRKPARHTARFRQAHFQPHASTSKVPGRGRFRKGDIYLRQSERSNTRFTATCGPLNGSTVPTSIICTNCKSTRMQIEAEVEKPIWSATRNTSSAEMLLGRRR